MLIFANIQFCLSSQLVFRVTFLQSELLWAKLKIFISGKFPEFYGEITFFASKLENSGNKGQNCVSIPFDVFTHNFSGLFHTLNAKSKQISGPRNSRLPKIC